MFKFFSRADGGRRLESLICLLYIPMWLAVVGCHTVTPPPVDLAADGWTVSTGQAVWRQADGTEMAGEILAAKHRGGEEYIQFTKNPFPVMLLRSFPEGWELQVPIQNRRFSGRGTPPQRLILCQLLRAISGEPLSRDWSCQTQATGSQGSFVSPQGIRLESRPWKLLNLRTGESMEGSFSQ